MSIEAGCNGVEATIVLIAAMLAFPAPWKRKLVGLAIGVIAVQGLNIIRVISLFYLGQWNFDAFEFAHLYVWQALIMLDVLIVWLLWVRTLPRAAPARAVGLIWRAQSRHACGVDRSIRAPRRGVAAAGVSRVVSCGAAAGLADRAVDDSRDQDRLRGPRAGRRTAGASAS